MSAGQTNVNNLVLRFELMQYLNMESFRRPLLLVKKMRLQLPHGAGRDGCRRLFVGGGRLSIIHTGLLECFDYSAGRSNGHQVAPMYSLRASRPRRRNLLVRVLRRRLPAVITGVAADNYR
jgi:hypothetical protein